MDPRFISGAERLFRIDALWRNLRSLLATEGWLINGGGHGNQVWELPTRESLAEWCATYRSSLIAWKPKSGSTGREGGGRRVTASQGFDTSVSR